MEDEKKLYPFRFIHLDENPSEDVHIADLGYLDSLVHNGWLAANSISEIMDMYMDRVVGEHVFNYYGRQFPVCVKILKGNDRTPLLVHPDDEIAEQRFDFLGKSKLWYVLDSRPGSKIYLGFKEDVSAEVFYMACRHGEVESLLNAVEPEKGQYYFIYPGLVHAACEGVEILEISESSPLDFKLFNWGREMELDEFDAELNLEAAFDFIDYRKYCRCHHQNHECHCHDEGHHEDHECHCHEDDHDAGKPVKKITDCVEFSVSELKLSDPLHIYSEQFDSFVLYTCVSGELSLQVSAEEGMINYKVPARESILVPAEVPDFFLVPTASDTVLLETIVEPRPDVDSYINPSSEASCGCDEEGCDCGNDEFEDDCACEDECACGHHHHTNVLS